MKQREEGEGTNYNQIYYTILQRPIFLLLTNFKAKVAKIMAKYELLSRFLLATNFKIYGKIRA